MAYTVDPISGELTWTSDDPTTPGANPNRNQPTGDTGGGDGGYDYAGLFRRLAGYTGGAATAAQGQQNFDNQLGLSQWAQNENARLNRDRFALTAPGVRLRDSTRASVTSNYQPTRVSFAGQGSGRRGVLPTISGGASYSLTHLDPRTRELSDRVMSDELASQVEGGITGRGGDRAMSRMPRAGGNPNLANAARAAGLASALTGPGGPGSGSSGDISRLISDIRDHYRDRTPAYGYGSQGHFDADGNWVTEGDTDSFTGPIDDPLYDRIMQYVNENPNDQYHNLPGYGTNPDGIQSGGSEDSASDPDWWNYGDDAGGD